MKTTREIIEDLCKAAFIALAALEEATENTPHHNAVRADAKRRIRTAVNSAIDFYHAP